MYVFLLFLANLIFYFQISYLDMLQFKEQRIVRKYLIISTWTAKVDKKRYADERKYDRYCKSKVLEIIAKPNVEKENEDVHTLEKEDKNVQIDRGVGENAAMNDVEKVSTMLKKLAAIVVEFEKVMARFPISM